MSDISYMICATPRSGSTLLCHALRDSGIAGEPDEYFGPMHVSRWQAEWGDIPLANYVARVKEAGSTANGVFGVKIMQRYWQHFLNTLSPHRESWDAVTAHQVIATAFPNIKYIWMTRRDKVRQGVSWAKAMQGVPWVWMEAEPFAPEQELAFDFEMIDQFVEQTILHEAAWQEFFRVNGIVPMVVVYEDFVQNYEGTVTAVCSADARLDSENGVK